MSNYLVLQTFRHMTFIIRPAARASSYRVVMKLEGAERLRPSAPSLRLRDQRILLALNLSFRRPVCSLLTTTGAERTRTTAGPVFRLAP